MQKVLNNKLLLVVVAILLAVNIAMLVFFVWMKPQKKDAHDERSKSPVTVFLEQTVGLNQQQMYEFEKNAPTKPEQDGPIV